MRNLISVSVGLAILPGLLFLSSCKRQNKAVQADDATVPQELIERGNFYCEASRPEYEEKKYVHSKCDGAGFTSLYSTRCGMVDLSVFEDSSTGKPYRSPSHDCFSTGSSKSEYSRDMLLMRMVAGWVHKDLTWLNRFISYAEKNNWVMCDAIDDAARIGRCMVSPNLISLLFDMQTRLEGKALLTKSEPDVNYPEFKMLSLDAQIQYLKVTKEDENSQDAVDLRYDFEAHLDVLRIWLEGQVYGGITDAQKKRLIGYAEREQRNALFLAVAALYGHGSMLRVWELLEAFPEGRLPASGDHCTEYLFQRAMMKNGAENPDWLPCDRGETHSGTDFNFALYVASGK